MDDKRQFRQLKREIKKEGNRNRRNHLKRQLRANPEEAHWDEYTFRWDGSKILNGMDDKFAQEIEIDSNFDTGYDLTREINDATRSNETENL